MAWRKPDFKLLELATTFNGVTPDQSRRIGLFCSSLEASSSKFGQPRLQIQIEGRLQDLPEMSRVAPVRVFGDENVQRSKENKESVTARASYHHCRHR